MGKRTTEKDGMAKILYQKSNTIYTQSKTCSGVSQLYTRKSVAKIKDNLRHSKIEAKRKDLSIETDICVLRRFCKTVKNKLSDKEDTIPTRHPIATEIKAVKEFQPPDTSACGDTPCKPTKTNYRNFTDIFIQNFKTILKKWIENHIIDEEMTTENLQTILTTLLKKDSANTSNKSASRSTYVVDKEPETSVDSKEETLGTACKKCFKKLGHVQESTYYCDTCRMSLPVSLNKLRIISTLSIPRNLHIKVKNLNKKKCDRNKKKSKKKNLVLSFNKSSQITLSSVDFLSISAESFTKRCANYAKCKGKKIEPKAKKKRLNVFFPKANKKSSSETFVRRQWTRIGRSENTLSEMASLVQTIFANDTIHIESTEDSDVIQVNDNYTMTEDRELVTKTYSQKNSKTLVSDKIINTASLQASFKKLNELDQSESMLTIDFPNQSSHIVKKDEVAASDTSPAVSSVDKNKTRIKKHHYKVIKNKCFRNQTINQRIRNKINKIQQQRLTKHSNIYLNDFPLRFPNDNPISGIRNFFEYWQDVIKYFSDDIKNDLKLDVQINIAPVADVTNQDNFTLMSKQELVKSVPNLNETLVFNFNHSEHTFTNNAPETDCLTDVTTIDESIPIASTIVSNNLIKDLSDIRETSKPDDQMSTASKGTLTDTKIMDDIKELKQIIKELTKAAKVFMSSGSNEYLEVDKSKQPGNTKCGTSKSIQTGRTAGNTSPVSVFKVSGGPKGTLEFITRMLKRSVSYSVIDSEQILRVTDMTSTANRIKSSNNLPKSRSLIEITSDRKRKLITYFCNSITSNNVKKMQKSLGRKAEEYSSATDSTMLSYSKTDMNYRRKCGLDCCTYTGAQPDEEQGLCACSKDIKPCRRKLGSKEGAIYCMILWIPIIVIVSLFVVFFLRDYATPNSVTLGLGPLKQYADDSRATPAPIATPAKNHETSGSADQFSIKMSDLGF